MYGMKQMVRNTFSIQESFSWGACTFVLVMIFIGSISCHKTNMPTHVKQAEQTAMLKGGMVYMYGDSNFSISIPTIEVQQYEVTNASFEQFVKSTGYITQAEKTKEAMVFDEKKKEWTLKKGADWKHPQGPGSNIQNKKFHPVVQVSYEDACAYCEWMNMRLPYESEWEYMFKVDAQKPAVASNHWDGIFPIEDKGTDGFIGTSQVGYFGKGGGDCYDMQGNVWEWCLDYYHEQWPLVGLQFNDSNRYTGPSKSFAENGIYDTLRVIKGGSFLCADNYCKGYTNTVRMHADPNLGYEHTGFRCVRKTTPR
jgi:sulfatase modifying factor 1